VPAAEARRWADKTSSSSHLLGKTTLYIPERLAAACRGSAERRTWLERLPDTIGELQDRWRLSLGHPFDAPLILGKVYRVVPDARAAKDDLVRIIDESGEDDLFHKKQFALVDFPQAVRKKILALQRAS